MGRRLDAREERKLRRACCVSGELAWLDSVRPPEQRAVRRIASSIALYSSCIQFKLTFVWQLLCVFVHLCMRYPPLFMSYHGCVIMSGGGRPSTPFTRLPWLPRSSLASSWPSSFYVLVFTLELREGNSFTLAEKVPFPTTTLLHLPVKKQGNRDINRIF